MRVVLVLLLNFARAMSRDQYDEVKPMKPEKCLITPNYLYRSCCIFPPFFPRVVADKCGSRTEVLHVDPVHNVTSYVRKALNSCAHWTCVLREYRLLDDRGFLDDDKYYVYLDLWVGVNPVFANAMLEAKVACRDMLQYFLPIKPCEFYRLHGCIRNYINLICPMTLRTAECNILRDFFKECRDSNFL